MTDEPDAVATDATPDPEPQQEQRPTGDHGRPVDDGPGQHHPNADTSHTAVSRAKTTHRF